MKDEIRRLLRLRRWQDGRRRTAGQEVRERKAEAQLDLLAGKGLAGDDGLVDFERDSKGPGES